MKFNSNQGTHSRTRCLRFTVRIVVKLEVLLNLNDALGFEKDEYFEVEGADTPEWNPVVSEAVMPQKKSVKIKRPVLSDAEALRYLIDTTLKKQLKIWKTIRIGGAKNR